MKVGLVPACAPAPAALDLACHAVTWILTSYGKHQPEPADCGEDLIRWNSDTPPDLWIPAKKESSRDREDIYVQD